MKDRDVNAEPEEVEATEPRVDAIDPATFEAMRVRAEGAERKLREIQSTFLAAKAELESTRARLERDLSRKVELKFGDLVVGLLECADDLDRAIEHSATIGPAAPVIEGVVLARDRFLSALAKAGLERIDPVGEPYDPNVAEAAGLVPVSDPQAQDAVVAVERVGYRLGTRIVRPARVLVGRLVS